LWLGTSGSRPARRTRSRLRRRESVSNRLDERGHGLAENLAVVDAGPVIVRAHGSLDGGLPVSGQVLESPRSRGPLGAHRAARLEGPQDPAAVQDGIRGLERIAGVTLV